MADNDRQRALIVIDPGADIGQVVAAVSAAGGHVVHRFSPDALIADVPADSLPLAGTSVYFTGPVPDEQLVGLTATAQQAARIWNDLLSQPGLLRQESGDLENIHHHAGPDAFVAPPPDTGLGATGGGASPDYYETSEYLMGQVAVGIVLPESNGGTDPSTENWTAEEQALVSSKIVEALDWWAQREPQARLSFVYDNLIGASLPTAVEPISRPYYDQRFWIGDTMSAKGYDGSSYFDQVRQYNNDLRSQYQTDWAFTIFVVDSSNDGDNRFSDGFFAYAYLGGPFMVMTYGNNGYGPNYMNAVAAHEIGHVFGALDQYAGAGQACDRQAGYLDVENQNSELGCAINDASIMRGQIWPYLNGAIDPYARGQVGWRDSDGDQILDPVDVDIHLSEVSYSPETPALSNVLTFAGTIDESPFPSPSGRDILINELTQVEYRVDDGLWFPATARDGAFDYHRENFDFVTDPMPTGSHAVEVRVVDSFDNVLIQPAGLVNVVDPVEARVETTIVPPGLAGPVERGHRAQYQGAARGEGYTVVDVQYRLDAGPWQSAQAQDGAFDSQAESFSFELDTGGLVAGTHLVQARTLLAGGFADSTPASSLIEIKTSAELTYLPLIAAWPVLP